jgi:hypothetical protein
MGMNNCHSKGKNWDYSILNINVWEHYNKGKVEFSVVHTKHLFMKLYGRRGGRAPFYLDCTKWSKWSTSCPIQFSSHSESLHLSHESMEICAMRKN